MKIRFATLGLALAALALPQFAQAAPPNIVSLAYIHAAEPNCESTVSGDPCSPIGVTQSGGLNNPFLNNLATKEINLGAGSYYTFGNPWAGTDFMIQGDSISVDIGLSNGQQLVETALVPDLSVAGLTVFDFPADHISIVTTGLAADRVSFGYPPTAFAGDGVTDYVLRLNYLPVPEPATWAMLLLGVGAIGAAMRMRRREEVAPAAAA